jgi:hypothetical protein
MKDSIILAPSIVGNTDDPARNVESTQWDTSPRQCGTISVRGWVIRNDDTPAISDDVAYANRRDMKGDNTTSTNRYGFASMPPPWTQFVPDLYSSSVEEEEEEEKEDDDDDDDDLTSTDVGFFVGGVGVTTTSSSTAGLDAPLRLRRL